jgi:hypothetical protein
MVIPSPSRVRLAAVLAPVRRTIVGRRLRAVAALLSVATSIAVAQSSAGQSGTVAPRSDVEGRTVDAGTPDATRAELTAFLEDALKRASDSKLRNADRQAAQTAVAATRHRLETGDFQPGDRFGLVLIVDSVHRTEVVVREGPSVELGAIPALSLAGVLRAELETALVTHLKRYYRSPEVRVQPIMRVTVVGPVTRPGPVSVAPDMVLGDVFAAVGGLSPAANTDRIVVLRSGREVVKQKAVAQAIREGTTLKSLGIRPGDEIRVGAQSRRDWRQIALVSSLTLSAMVTVLALIRSSYSD